MRVKRGFVTNSSAVSYIVIFGDKRDASPDDKMLVFDEYNYHFLDGELVDMLDGVENVDLLGWVYYVNKIDDAYLKNETVYLPHGKVMTLGGFDVLISDMHERDVRRVVNSYESDKRMEKMMSEKDKILKERGYG